MGHFLDVDLRPEGVTIRTFSRQDGALSKRDIELARQISAVARMSQLEPDPSECRQWASTVAQDAGGDVRPFWAAALEYDLVLEDAVDGQRRNPHVTSLQLNPPKPGRGVSTSTSACRQTRPRLGSRRHSQRADGSSTIRTCRTGGH